METPPAGPAPADSFCCPHLGLVDDRETRYLFPSPGHRCFAARKPQEVGEAHQAAWCLVAAHAGCGRFTPPVPAGERRPGLAGLMPLPDPDLAAIPASAPGQAITAPGAGGPGDDGPGDYFESVEAPDPKPASVAGQVDDLDGGAGGPDPGAATERRIRLAVLLFLVALVAVSGAALIALGPPSLATWLTDLGLAGAPAATPFPTAPLPSGR